MLATAFYYGKLREGYWDAEIMVDDVEAAIDVCEEKFA